MLFNNTNLRTTMTYTNAVGDKVYPVIVDIKKGIKSTEEILFVSSDINTGILSVAFIQGNDTYNVTGAEVVCSIMRPDASTLDIPCTVIENNIVEVPLGVNGTSQDGVYSFDFKVFKGGNKVVGTPTMNYSVSLSISNDNAVLEDDRLPVLTMLMTQVNELKEETRETVNQANTATEATKVATANAIEVTNKANEAVNKVTQDTANAIANVNATSDTMVENVNNAISSMDTTVNNKISEVDTAKNEMTATVTNKVNEVEGRFNALTASQQQDAEVIDARDGETSLKARLDRDIEKANKELDKIKKLEESTVSTVTTESDFTTVEATSGGYFEDVKLEGKTLVNLCTGNVVPHTSGNRLTQEVVRIVTDFTIINTSNKITSMTIYKDGIFNRSMFFNANTITHIKLLSNEKIGAISYLYENGWTSENIDEAKMNTILLEGDHTQNPPSYFEGLKSVGDGADEIVVLSQNNGNIFDGYFEIGDMNSSNGQDESNSLRKRSGYIECKTPSIYFNNTIARLCWYDKNKQFISYIGSITNATRPKMACYFRFSTVTTTFDIVDTVVSSTQSFKKDIIKQDKKRLLYYNNETQTWEKPILREWDSIEKHSDGKYYYHKRSGEVVLNGSENIIKYKDHSTVISFNVSIEDSISNTNKDYFISDKINFKQYCYDLDIEGIAYSPYVKKNVYINIAKSKLSTQDVQGFKQWLQANNVTVVYQLAQEKVYECTNIDLITYANETNYIVECGAIVPKTTLKVHNNISNVVKILQEKVSLLESNIKASQEVQDMMILETDMRMLDIELALMEFAPMKLNLGGSDMLRSATYFNFLKNHIINETYEKEYLENVMNKYLATGRINQDEYDELYKMLYPPVYDIELPIEP